MITKIYAILVGILMVSVVNAQSDYRPGWIVSSQGDTLQGSIKYGNLPMMSQVCEFKDNNNEKRKYYPNDISCY